MDSLLNSLKSALNNKDVPDEFKTLLNNIANNNSNSATTNAESKKNTIDFSNVDINTIIKIQEIMKKINSSEPDSRSTLLRSLKPFLKKSRQDKVEQYIQLLNMEQIFKMFNNNDNK